MITTKEEHQDQHLAGTGLYVDMENLHTEGQALIQGLIDDWPGNTPPPSHLNLYVHADQTELWRLWASSQFKNMEIRAHGTQHFSSSSSKNSADMAIVAHAVADLTLRRITHVAVLSNDSDFISLYTAIRDDPSIPDSEGRVPFLWVITSRNGFPLTQRQAVLSARGNPHRNTPRRPQREPLRIRIASPHATQEPDGFPGGFPGEFPGGFLGKNSADTVADGTTGIVQEHRLPAYNSRALVSPPHRQDRRQSLWARVQKQYLAHIETARGQDRQPRKEAGAVRDAGHTQRKLDTGKRYREEVPTGGRKEPSPPSNPRPRPTQR